MNRLTAIAIGLIACLIVSLGWAVNHYRDRTTQYAKEKNDLQAQITSQQAIITKQIQQAQQFNSIAAGVESEKQQTTDAGEKVRVIYKTVLDRSPCARNVVDRDVADGLLNHASKVRSGTGDANAGKPDR